MYASTLSVALVGGDAIPVQVEAFVGKAKDGFRLSGLPDTALRESRDRIRAAITSAGIEFSHRELTVNLAPADLPKKGSDYDLPIAVGILAADGFIKGMGRAVIVGELSLEGKVRAGSSSLGAAVISARLGIPCLVAADNAAEVARVPGSQVYPVDSLADTVSLLAGGFQRSHARPDGDINELEDVPDLSDVRGQLVARRALEIAAAGGHHILFYGPPGGGKTMLARRLPGLLPRLDDRSAIEVALVRASLGMNRLVSNLPPFRAPHHSATRAALVGGGSGIPTPGEISLAHRGVLFLDELAEFPRTLLDALRQPLEEGWVHISRQGSSAEFPASFQLVGASNPCPCGFFGDYRRPCVCSENTRSRYRQRISGPMLDRFDLSVKVNRVEVGDFDGEPGEPTAIAAARVDRARQSQSERGNLNRDLKGGGLDRVTVETSASPLLRAALERGDLTARGSVRVRRVARTIADLDGGEFSDAHVGEALAMRVNW